MNGLLPYEKTKEKSPGKTRKHVENMLPETYAADKCFPDVCQLCHTALFPATKYVSAWRQKHILLLEKLCFMWQDWETLGKHVSAVNVSGNMLLARFLVLPDVQRSRNNAPSKTKGLTATLVYRGAVKLQTWRLRGLLRCWLSLMHVHYVVKHNGDDNNNNKNNNSNNDAVIWYDMHFHFFSV